jgi:hypothetical protein
MPRFAARSTRELGFRLRSIAPGRQVEVLDRGGGAADVVGAGVERSADKAAARLYLFDYCVRKQVLWDSRSAIRSRYACCSAQ